MNGTWSAGGAWGSALFMRQGLVAWMRAWPQPTTDDPPVPQPTASTVTPTELSSSLSGQLITILANMVFTARQEVFA